MTIWDVIRINRRWWALLLLGLVATSVATFVVREHTGAYGGRAKVTFLAPQPIRGNALARTTSSMIALAGIVAHLTGGPGGDAQSVSDEVTLLGEGVTDGFSIRQPNAGGQWEYRFEDPVLDVQSAGPTLERSQEQMTAALNKITATLTELQDRAGVSDDQRITIQLGPGDPTFTYEHGSTARATAATVLLGLILSFSLPVVYERFVRRPPHTGGSSGRRRGPRIADPTAPALERANR